MVARRVVQVGEDQPVLAGGGWHQHLPADSLYLGADGGHILDHHHEDGVVRELAAGVEDSAAGRIRPRVADQVVLALAARIECIPPAEQVTIEPLGLLGVGGPHLEPRRGVVGGCVHRSSRVVRFRRLRASGPLATSPCRCFRALQNAAVRRAPRHARYRTGVRATRSGMQGATSSKARGGAVTPVTSAGWIRSTRKHRAALRTRHQPTRYQPLGPAMKTTGSTSRSEMAATIFCTALRAASSNGPTLTCASATAMATASAGVKFSGGSVSDLSTV